jgi:hypothetical protein
MSKLAVVSDEAVQKIVTRQLAFDAVKEAFEAVATNRAQVFDVAIGTGLHDGEAFAIKSGIDRDNELVYLPMDQRSCCSTPRPDFRRHW